MQNENDWRLMSQEKYLMEQELVFVPNYSPNSENWKHEHCCFCFQKISQCDGDLHECYRTKNERNWICKQCYGDFKRIFKWVVIGM